MQLLLFCALSELKLCGHLYPVLNECKTQVIVSTTVLNIIILRLNKKRRWQEQGSATGNVPKGPACLRSQRADYQNGVFQHTQCKE